MTAQEKEAWLNLAVVCLVIVVFLVLLPALGAQRAMSGFALLGLLAVIPFCAAIGRKRGGRVLVDERDRAIRARAVTIAYSAFWVLFVLGTMGLWAIYRDRGVLPADLLPLFPLVGWALLTLVQSSATLVQYRRER